MSDDLREPDSYEAEFMGADDDVVHREKLSYPPWFRWFLGIALTLGLGLGVVSAAQAGDMGAVALVAAMMPLMFFMMASLSTLRVTVKRDELAVQYGPVGPKIPIERIEHCEAEDYEMWKYGGYGIRYSAIEGAWCYNMVGDKGKAVRVHYRTDSGRLKKLLIASPRHHILADTINRARIAIGHDVPARLAPDDAALGLDDDVLFTEQTSLPEEVVLDLPEEEVDEVEQAETQVR